jgi:hypothetical protein
VGLLLPSLSQAAEHLETVSRYRPSKIELRGEATRFKVSALTAVRSQLISTGLRLL